MGKKEENNEDNKDNELEDLNPELSKNHQNYKTKKNTLQSTAELTAATGELRSVGIAIAHLVDKSAKTLDRIAQLPAIRDIHFIAMGISGLALLLKLIKQVLFVFTLNSDERRQWWQKKTFGHKLAYILKTVLAAASIAVTVSAIFVPAAAAVILLATCYISAAAQGFIDVYRKLPKLIAQFKKSSQECGSIQSQLVEATDDTTREKLTMDLKVAKNQRSQHLLGIVSNIGNIAFNTAYIIGAALTIAIPPAGLIMLGITALSNIVFGVSTFIANAVLIKKTKMLLEQQEQSSKKEDKNINEKIIQQHADLKEKTPENSDTKHDKTSIVNNKQESNPKIEEPHLFKHSHHQFSSEAFLQLILVANLHVEKSLPEELSLFKNHFVFAEDQDTVYFINSEAKPEPLEGKNLETVKNRFAETFKSIAMKEKLNIQENYSELNSQKTHKILPISHLEKLNPRNENSNAQENDGEGEGDAGLKGEKTNNDEEGEGGNEKEKTDTFSSNSY